MAYGFEHPLWITDHQKESINGIAPLHGERDELMASHFKHLEDRPFHWALVTRAVTILEKPSFPQPGYPLYIGAYSPFWISDKPESWSNEVARRLALYPVLPDFDAQLSDIDLGRRFNVGIPGLSRTDVLRWILIRLEELKNIFVSTRRQNWEIKKLEQQISAVKTDIRREQKDLRKRRPSSGGCPGYDPEHDIDNRSGRSCERGNDPCDI